MDQLRRTLATRSSTIQKQLWNDYIAIHDAPYTPGIWQVLLAALRDFVRH